MFLPNIKVKAWPGPCSLKLVSWSKLIESSNRFSSKVRLCGLLFGWIKFIPKIIENRAFKIFITIKSVYQTHTKYISLFLFPLCKNNLIWQPTLDFQLLCDVFAVCWHPDGEWCGKSASCPNTAAARRPAPARRPGTCHWLISSKQSTSLYHIYVNNMTYSWILHFTVYCLCTPWSTKDPAAGPPSTERQSALSCAGNMDSVLGLSGTSAPFWHVKDLQSLFMPRFSNFPQFLSSCAWISNIFF